ncbi:MAG: AraC family transcriptional regulator [Mesorhizobium sp.]|nr:AraC family transcriptional regulator [Mesorhizobium sp.]
MAIEVDPFSLCELAPRGWLDMPKSPSASLHYVLNGTGALHLGSRRSLPVKPGDLVLVPAGASHSLGALDGRFVSFAACQPAQLGLSHHRAGSQADGQGLTVLCARISLGLQGAGTVIDLLREPIVESAGARHLIEMILHELAEPGPGSRAQVKSLLLYLVIAALRGSVRRQNAGTGWLVALADRNLWPALADVIARPGADHSVESLADRVGMSRARFAARFKARFGTGPMRIVRDLRLQHAARLLMEGTSGVARVAELVGFSSRSHFSEAFEARYGISPGKYGRAGAISVAPESIAEQIPSRSTSPTSLVPDYANSQNVKADQRLSPQEGLSPSLKV